MYGHIAKDLIAAYRRSTGEQTETILATIYGHVYPNNAGHTSETGINATNLSAQFRLHNYFPDGDPQRQRGNEISFIEFSLAQNRLGWDEDMDFDDMTLIGLNISKS